MSDVKSIIYRFFSQETRYLQNGVKRYILFNLFFTKARMLTRSHLKNLVDFNEKYWHSPSFGGPEWVRRRTTRTKKNIKENLSWEGLFYRFIEDPDGSGETIMVKKDDPKYVHIPTKNT